jgi:hypothetical protein
VITATLITEFTINNIKIYHIATSWHKKSKGEFQYYKGNYKEANKGCDIKVFDVFKGT